MRKIMLAAMVCSVYTIEMHAQFALGNKDQIYNYSDHALLVNEEILSGTARFRAMSGAFGALGGDYSAMLINPAGTAVFVNSGLSFSVGPRSVKTDVTFYGTLENMSNTYFNFNQLGGVLTFGNSIDSPWKYFGFGFLFERKNSLNDYFLAKGNSGQCYFCGDPREGNETTYDKVESQSFSNTTDGYNDRYSFTLGSNYNGKLYLGLSVSSHTIKFNQYAVLHEESNTNDNTATLISKSNQTLHLTGNGLSIGLGAIFKPTEGLRLGVAYESPVWYEMTENTSETIKEEVTDSNVPFEADGKDQEYTYKITTADKLTGSIAYVFEKKGLISFDYTYKNYGILTLNPASYFDKENEFLKNELIGSSQFRIGTEWRIEQLSLRAGYRFEQSPYKDRSYLSDLKGFSFGIGYNFKNFKIDLSHDRATQSRKFDIYPNMDNINVAKINRKISNFGLSVTIRL